jgi:hypothetical protein
MFAVYNAMITKIALIVKAFADHTKLPGAIDTGEPVIGQIGPIADASGNMYHGCEISIDITHFLEV